MHEKALKVAALGCGAGSIYLAKLFWDSRKCDDGKSRPKSKPSGPLALPVVGNLFQLSGSNDSIPDRFLEWAQSYGEMYMVYLGRHCCVVLNTWPVIDQAMGCQGHSLSSRPNTLPLIKLVYQERGLEWQNDELWKHERTCMNKAMRCCPVSPSGGLPMHECCVIQEAGKMIREMCKLEERDVAFCPTNLIHMGVTNIMASYLFACRYKYKSKSLQCLIDRIRRLTRVNVLDSTSFFPLLAKLPSFLAPKIREDVRNMEALVCMVDEEIKKHQNCRTACEPTCLLDVLLDTCDCGPNPCDEELEVALIDMLVCGTEPVSAALSWAVLCMIIHPDIQDRCHEEIDAVICPGTVPSLCNLRCLPYVKATLYEVLRRFTVLPLGIPHSARCAAGVADYCIPVGSVVICNIKAVHMNECYWDCPANFCPDRFYDASCPDAPRFVEREYFVPFGTGPRACVGKKISLEILHLLLVSLLHRFDFKAPDNCCDLTACLEGTYDFVFKPRPYRCKVSVHHSCRC